MNSQGYFQIDQNTDADSLVRKCKMSIKLGVEENWWPIVYFC